MLSPVMLLILSIIKFLLSSNFLTIFSISSFGPFKASTPAYWAIELVLEVTWLWTLVINLITSAFPAAYPNLHPVIA